jgi:hypothetical protein
MLHAKYIVYHICGYYDFFKYTKEKKIPNDNEALC